MSLREGTLGSLIKSGKYSSSVGSSLFAQMLQALACLAHNNIVHGDVKPENILYELKPDGQYHFQLTDFGIDNRVIDATDCAGGSQLYMAPEGLCRGKQTSKSDVWSLYVTMLWAHDTDGFRQKSNHFRSAEDILQAVLHASSVLNVTPDVRKMAFVNPDERVSAAQMLHELNGGVGLINSRDEVSNLNPR